MPPDFAPKKKPAFGPIRTYPDLSAPIRGVEKSEKKLFLYCVLCTVYCVLCTVYCVLCTVYCVLCTVYCVLCTVYCVLCTVYCVLCTVYCVLCTVYCVLCTVYCVLCTVYCVLLVGFCCLLAHEFCAQCCVHCSEGAGSHLPMHGVSDTASDSPSVIFWFQHCLSVLHAAFAASRASHNLLLLFA